MKKNIEALVRAFSQSRMQPAIGTCSRFTNLILLEYPLRHADNKAKNSTNHENIR
jgi:hypothetical protein